ncbi:MAG: App1 family protein [Actinomycetes bacterium]
MSDHIREWRETFGRRHGQLPTVVPYTGYGSTSWIRVLGRVLLTSEEAPRLTTPEPHGVRGWRSFTSVPVNEAAVIVSVGDQRHTVVADRSGIIDAVVPVELEPGWHTIGLQAEDPGPEPPPVDIPPQEARVYVVDPKARLGIVSDVDDTVMVTALPRPLLAAWHAFVLNEHSRRPTPGMPVLYERLNQTYATAPVVYLSTGAWNVAPTLTRFLSRNLYPPGPLLLTDWGPTETSWFRSGTDHKHRSLERLTTEFPDIRWLLVGDDGQHDEEIYGEFVDKHPDRVVAVCIRQLSPGQAVLAGSAGRSHIRSGEETVPWLYASDGAGFAQKLEDLGILGELEQAAQPQARA